MGFVSSDDIKRHFESLSLLLGVNNVTSKVENLSEQNIKVGADMFVYLNSCPSYWVYFYHEIFNSTNSVSEIIQLTMNTLKKKTKRKGELIASQLLWKLSSELEFEYLVPEKVETLENIDQPFFRNIKNVQGDYFFLYSQSLTLCLDLKSLD